VLHLDELTGRLARIPQLIRSRPENTIARLATYRDKTLDELFPAPETIPDVQTTRRWSFGGLVSEDLVFPSTYQPLEPEFAADYHRRKRSIQTVYAKRVRPKGLSAEGKRLIYIHGYMQPETLIEELGVVSTMARALGVEVVQLQPPYHGRRKPRSSPYDGELYWTADVVRSFEALRQTLYDARVLRSILEREASRQVGITGLSLGGSLSAMLTCFEPGFDFSIPIIAHMDMGALLRDAPVLHAMRRDLARFGWTHEEFGDFFRSIGWEQLTPQVPIERILILAATKDRFFGKAEVEAMWRSWGKPEIHWYPTSHMGFIPHFVRALVVMRRFIERLPAPGST